MENTSSVNASKQCGRRDLFSNVIPSSTDANIGEPEQRGICFNGWRTTDCENYDDPEHADQYKESSAVHIAIGACIFSAIFSVTYFVFSY